MGFKCSPPPPECLCIEQTTIATETPITPINTDTVDIAVSGAYDHTLQADVKISSQVDNAISVLSDGLYVPSGTANCPESRACFSGVDTSSIDYQYNSVTGQHSANIKVSTSPGNSISVNPDGVFSPAVTVSDNGDRTFTINNQTTSINVCQGFSSLQTTNPGNSCQSIGPNFLVKNVALSDCTLQIWSGAEHATQSSQLVGSDPAVYNPVVGSYVVALITSSLIIQSPQCRSVNGLLFIKGAVEINKPSGVGFGMILDVSTNGGASWSAVGAYNLNSGVAFNGTYDVQATPIITSLAANTSQNTQARMRLTQTGGVFGDIIISARNIVISSIAGTQ